MNQLLKKHDRDYFLKLFNGITDAVFISERCKDGKPGNYVEVNDVACDLLGYGRNELLQISPYEVNRVAVEEQNNFDEVLEAIEIDGKTLFKTGLRHRDGYWIPVEIGSQIFELDGKDVYFSVARDITLRERYESSIKTLVRSTVGLTGQECLEEIVRNLCDWLDVEGAGIGLLQNDTLEIKSCFFQGQFKTTQRLPVKDSPFVEILQGKFTIYPEGAGAYFPQPAFPHLSQSSGFIGCPMQGHQGQVLGVIYAYSCMPIQSVPHVEELLSVIASRAVAECERMRYVRELSHSEEMLRTLFNSTAEAIVGIDMAGEVVFCNPSTIKILGYKEESELIGESLWKIVSTPHGNDKIFNHGECPFISSIAKEGTISSEDGFFSHSNGHQVPVEYWGHPMHRDNQLIGGVITFIDISRRKTLEKQLQHSQRMEAIGTLTGGIAHDFNNILTVISGYVGLLKSQYSDNAKLVSRIMKIGEAAERGSKLTHGLLAYSRKKSEPSTPVDLNQLVLNVQDLFGRMIGEGIEKHLILSADQLIVLADPSQLEQVLVNLATNARDAMSGGGKLTMRTERTEIDSNFCQMYGYGEPGQYALITVEDSGVGIPREIQQKIFDPFFTTKDTGKGTGLGLAMAWGIVKQHKGYILVESDPGKGSRFKIYLPQTEQPLAVKSIQSTSELPRGTETILLVEDDPLVRESTCSILSAVGYHVVTCDCAEAGLTCIEQKGSSLDLVLSDVIMPGMKGPEFYQEIRKKSAIPIIFMSGYTFDYLQEQGLVKEEVLLLNKPIEPLELLTEIRQSLNKIQQS
jgi:PAS domain S-box-containing protein